MSRTTKLTRDGIHDYFDDFTKRFLRDDSPEAIDIEVISTDLGDLHVAESARLTGITFDSHGNTLEIALESGDHRVEDPAEVWVEEEDDGFVSAIEVVRAEGEREILSLKRSDPERR